MAHIHDLVNVNLLRPSMVTIGVFDGVHRGHQYLARKLVEQARAAGDLAVVLTFFPHPDMVLRGLTGRYYLMSPEQRAEALLNLGVDFVITHPFNDATRLMPAADFVDLLVRQLKVRDLWVGADFALGYQREGDVAFLTAAGERKGFTVHPVNLMQTEDDDQIISSTQIRDALQRGEVELARQWMGRSYMLSGEVVHGEGRGRQIGYPTANIAVWEQQIIPANGIYASWAYLNGERYMAMTNIGVSPTFAYRGVTVEAYLLDFDRDIYGQALTISFEKYLRPEAKFTGLQALMDQIAADVAHGRAYLGG